MVQKRLELNHLRVKFSREPIWLRSVPFISFDSTRPIETKIGGIENFLFLEKFPSRVPASQCIAVLVTHERYSTVKCAGCLQFTWPYERRGSQSTDPSQIFLKSRARCAHTLKTPSNQLSTIYQEL